MTKISVKRGLTRLKTIDAQLERIQSKFADYAVVSSKDKVDLVETNKVSIEDNHKKARAEMVSLTQQYEDLIAEYFKIKEAILASNLVATITIDGQTMTIARALIMQNEVVDKYQSVLSLYAISKKNAERGVEKYNAKFSKLENVDELKLVMAEPEFLVSPAYIEKKAKFISEFKAELNGMIDESNILTNIEY